MKRNKRFRQRRFQNKFKSLAKRWNNIGRNQERKRKLKPFEFAFKRPPTPHNTTQFLINNFQNYNQQEKMPIGFCETFKPVERVQELNLIAKSTTEKSEDFLINSNNLWKIVDSQQSTSAGESSDDDFYSARISSIPGLTMQGIVDEDMFEVNLDEASDEFYNSSQFNSQQAEQT